MPNILHRTYQSTIKEEDGHHQWTEITELAWFCDCHAVIEGTIPFAVQLSMHKASASKAQCFGWAGEVRCRPAAQIGDGCGA